MSDERTAASVAPRSGRSSARPCCCVNYCLAFFFHRRLFERHVRGCSQAQHSATRAEGARPVSGTTPEPRKDQGRQLRFDLGRSQGVSPGKRPLVAGFLSAHVRRTSDQSPYTCSTGSAPTALVLPECQFRLRRVLFFAPRPPHTASFTLCRCARFRRRLVTLVDGGVRCHHCPTCLAAKMSKMLVCTSAGRLDTPQSAHAFRANCQGMSE